MDFINDKDYIQITTDQAHKRFLLECYKHAETSRHPTTHNAALLTRDEEILLRGANNLPPGVRETPERLQGDNRHMFPNHAERDVLYKAAREGIPTNGCTMYMPWFPCINCANGVITAGIEHLIVHKNMIDRTRESWRKELNEAVEILKEAGVRVSAYDGLVGAKAFMHGEEWDA